MSSLLIGAAVGSGISAFAAERGGADFLLAINAARLRNMGVPSIVCMLPTHHAHNLVNDFAVNEVLPRVSIPVYLGVSSWVRKESPQEIVSEACEQGFSGVVNFPSAMHFSFDMRQILEAAGLGVTREIEILAAAKEAGLESLFYCGSRSNARVAAYAGITNILFNFGWNAGGQLGHRRRLSLEECGVVAREIGSLVKGINPKVQFFLEGGPIVTAEDLGYVAKYAMLDGYVGGSTLDRLPFASSIADRIAGYKHAAEIRHSAEKKDDALLAWSREFGFVGRSARLIQFLQAFKKFCLTKHAFAIVAEQGLDERPLFACLRSNNRGPVVVLDMAENATQAVLQLFGNKLVKRSARPLLAAESAPVIIVRNPHCLPDSVQRRIAAAIFQGSVSHPKDRKALLVTARVVFLRNCKIDRPPALVAELEELLQGWSVVLPPIRDRASDFPVLFDRQVMLGGMRSDQLAPLSTAADHVFRGHYWPQNDFDLHRIAGVMLSQNFHGNVTQAEASQMISDLDNTDSGEYDVPDEKKRLVGALWRNGFHRGNTAVELGISRKTLYNKMIKFGLSQSGR